jgi:uncharacterized protein
MTAPLPTLREFLGHQSRPESTLTYHELQGFLFAVAAAPEFVGPSEWLPLIFDEQDPGYASVDEAQHILDQITALYNEVNAAILEKRAALPADCTVHADAVQNLEPSAPLSRWSRGFLVGHQWLEELWEVDLPREMDEEVGAIVMTLSFFVSRPLADAIYNETDPKKTSTFAALAEHLLALVPEAIQGYAFFGRTVLAEAYASTPSEEPVEPGRAGNAGPDDPCPCGSGETFTNCCGGTVQ